MIGIDIENVDRFNAKPNRFYEKIFSSKEIEYALRFENSAQHFAGIFCAKEAIMKALGHGLNEIDFHSIEITHLPAGQPTAKLTGKAKFFLNSKAAKLHISISHTDAYATAICLISPN